METRNIQRTGGASFSVTLPKHWVEKFNLQDKDPVELAVQPSGALLIQPQKMRWQKAQVVCDINGLTPDEITREIIAGYLSGADEITLQSDRLDQLQRTQIRQGAQRLMGFEIIDESSNKITIRNIFDSLRFSIPQNVERMLYISQSMFVDAMSALSTNDSALAKDVIERDVEVNKLNFAIMRQFHSLMAGKNTEEELHLSLVDCNYYSFVAAQIERIADHTAKIARIVLASKSTPKKISLVAYQKVANKIDTYLDQSILMIQELSKHTAHIILNDYQTNEKENAAQAMVNSGVEPLIADSLDRLQQYIRNIAEKTIDQAVMVAKQ